MSVWPVDAAKIITQAFGARPEDYAPYGFPGHEGVDLRATLDTPVRAVAAGTIGRVTDTGNYGKCVRVLHTGGWQTTYAHLNRFGDLATGATVRAGDVIGYAGSTGNSTGVHLHLGLKHEGFVYTDAAGTVWPFNIHDPTPYLEPLMAGPVTVDVLPYLRGDHRRQFDLGYATGTQTTQVILLSPDDWLYVKGRNGDYERLGLGMFNGTEWIFRFEDTSESVTRFYAHYATILGPIGAPWFPRHATLGMWYATTKAVQHYLKDGCVKQNGGMVTDRLRLLAGPRTVTYPESGAVVEDVITIEWASGEQYDFARGRGNIAFRDATRRFWFIGDVQGRDNLPVHKPDCINLGW